MFYTRTEAADHDVALHHADSSGIDVLLYPAIISLQTTSQCKRLFGHCGIAVWETGEKPPKEVLRQMELYDQILATADEARQ